MTSEAFHESPAPEPPAGAGSSPPHDLTPKLFVLGREECLELLASQRFGRLAVSMDSPVIRPVNYVFDERSQSVAFRTADGSKFHAMITNGQAVFEIDGIDPESRTGWSVIVAGVTEEVTSPSARRRLDQLGLETWPPGHKAHWIRIRAWTVSGRRIVVSAAAAAGRPT